MTVSQASRSKTGKRSSTDTDSLISQGIRKQPGEKGSLVGLFPLTVQPDQQSRARFPGKELHPPLCRRTNDPYCGIGEIFSPPEYGRMGYRSRFGEARSRMGDHAAGDRLCPEFPTGQRLDMTGSLPRRRRRKLSRNPGTETDKKLFPKSRPPAVLPRSTQTTKKSPPDLNDSAGFSVVPRSEGPARSFPRHEVNLASTAATCAREAWLPGDRFPSPVPRISPSPTAQPMASRAQGEI